MKRKAVLMVIVELVFLIVLGLFLTRIQTDVSVSDQKHNMEEKLEQVSETLTKASEESVQTKQNYDEAYQSKAQSLAFMYQNGVLSGYSDADMQEMQQLFDVSYVMVTDKSGQILAESGMSPADFTRQRFNQLRTVFETGEPSEAFEVEKDGKLFRYYGSKINDNAMVVLAQNPEDLYRLLDKTSTWQSTLGNVKVGLDGYAFAVSRKFNTFLYHPDEDLVGKDALSHGIDPTNLENNNFSWMTVGDEKIYAGVRKTEDAYVFCAVTAKELLSSRNTTVAIIMFVFFSVITLVITYAFFLMLDDIKDEKVPIFGGRTYNKTVGKKIMTISLVGLVCIMLISYYMQSLFSLSRQSMSNSQRVKEVEQKIDEYGDESKQISKEYDERYLTKCRIAAYIIDAKPELAEREKLAELSKILDVLSVNVFDESGVQTATNSPYTNFRVSDDPKSQSYEFQKVLLGMDHLIQKAQPDDVSGEYHQYIGVSLRSKEDTPNGFVQISIQPSKLAETLDNMQLDNILSKMKVGKGGIVFAVDKAKNKITYYPQEKIIGRNALKYGLKKAQLVDDYSGYMTLGNVKYYGSSLETEDAFVYAAVPEASMSGSRLPITIASVLAGIVSLAIIFLLLTIEKQRTEEEEEEIERKNKVMVDVVMPDGTSRKTKSAASRWGNARVEWEDKTAEQKFSSVLKLLVGILAATICLAIALKDKVFGKDSIFLYIIGGKWQRGMNIFAITSAIMIICVVLVVTMLLRNLLQLLSRTFGAKGETICRLLSSFVKYFSAIAMLYYCLALFGIDTKTLLASAGILTLVVGLGAQKLVSDILAGLFLIFEGEFQVGDIVTIGDCRGKVMEIGIRTTKILDASQNVKIISNNDVGGVVNMTRDYSYAWSDVGIEYGESLERVENVLEKEFPNIRKRLPKIMDGPFYKGVISLGDNSVNIRVMVLCAESDRVQMERDLNREMKLLFDKYDINIPFPQVVINQPPEFQKASESEKRKADRFNQAQRELTQNLQEDEDED